MAQPLNTLNTSPKKKTTKAKYSVIVHAYNNNDIRITCGNYEAIESIKQWYMGLTQQKVFTDNDQKYTKSIILDNARKAIVFGPYGWENIIIDHMLERGYQALNGGGQGAFSKLLFISNTSGSNDNDNDK